MTIEPGAIEALVGIFCASLGAAAGYGVMRARVIDQGRDLADTKSEVGKLRGELAALREKAGELRVLEDHARRLGNLEEQREVDGRERAGGHAENAALLTAMTAQIAKLEGVVHAMAQELGFLRAHLAGERR